MALIEIVDEINKLLLKCGENNWRESLDKIKQLLIENDFRDASRITISLFGGMGSFSDIVLHKNGQPLIDENDRLNQLRHDLFEEAQKCINTPNSHA